MKKFKRYSGYFGKPVRQRSCTYRPPGRSLYSFDIYTRYLRLRGEDVISVCGSDEHGVPITIKARQEGGLAG